MVHASFDLDLFDHTAAAVANAEAERLARDRRQAAADYSRMLAALPRARVCRSCTRELPIASFWPRANERCRDCCKPKPVLQTGPLKCRECGEIKPRSDFSIGEGRRSGRPVYNHQCKMCHASRRVKLPQVFALWSDKPGMKFCTRCGEEKHISEYSQRKNRYGNLKYLGQCKACIAINAARRNLNRAVRLRAIRLVNPKLKTCTACDVAKSLEEFVVKFIRPNGGVNRGRICTQCHRLAMGSRKAAREAIRFAATRLCKRCGETKPIDQFGKHERGYRYKCKDCDNAVQRVYGRNWTANNPKGQRAKERRRRAAERGAEGSHTIEDIERIRKAQKDRCCMPWCRVRLKGGGNIEHRVPLWAGGSDDAKNLQLACGPCNSSKGTRDEIEFVQSRNAVVRDGQLHLL